MSDNISNNCISCCIKVLSAPQRVLLTILSFCVISITIALRLLISISIIEMVNLPNNFTQDPIFDYCWTEICSHNSVVRNNEEQMNWNEQDVGFIFSAFALGYCIVQIPAGIISDGFSEKPLWVFGLLFASILTCLVPFAIKQGFMYLLLIRFGIGFFEGPILNAMNAMITNWFTEDEIWLVTGIVYSGIPFGGILATLAGGLIINGTNKWSSPFIIFGIAGIVFTIIFCLLLYSVPEKNPFLSEKEKEYLTANVTRPEIRLREIPWREILSNPAVVALVIVRGGQDFGFNILLNYFPKYYSDILCLDLIKTLWYTVITYFCGFVVTIISTMLGIYMVKRYTISATTIKKIFSTFSSILPAAFLVAANFFECNQHGVLFSFCFTMFGFGFYLSGLCTNELAISRSFGGTLSGISNAASGLAKIAGPIVVGYLVQWRSLTEWRVMIWSIFIVFNLCTLPFMVWGSGKDQQFEAAVVTLTPEEIEVRIAKRHSIKHKCIFL